MNIKIQNNIEDSLQAELVEYRRHIHSYPELGFKEFETAKYIKSILNKYNIETKDICETGFVADIGKGGHCIALRTELDGLPVEEKTNLEYSSKIPGRMHACGHDLHIAVLLGVAKVLKQNEDKIEGRVRLIFQPGEEVLPGGASKMIAANVLKDANVEYVFSQHIDPMLPAGTISIPQKEAMASTNELFWTIKGKASHAAQPHLGNDAILASVNIVNFIQSIVTKFRNPITPAVISVCSINGGNTTNIFPSEVKMQGVMRTFDMKLRKEIEELLIRKSSDIAALYNTSCELYIDHGYPALINNSNAVKIVTDAANNIFNKSDIEIAEPKLLAEDFAYFAQELPSCYWFMGTARENEEKYSLHSPFINPSEEVLIKGVKLFIEIVNTALNKLNTENN